VARKVSYQRTSSGRVLFRKHDVLTQTSSRRRDGWHRSPSL